MQTYILLCPGINIKGNHFDVSFRQSVLSYLSCYALIFMQRGINFFFFCLIY